MGGADTRPAPALRGYMSDDFARSYSEFGDIVTLPKSGLRCLRRPIDGTAFDCTGFYPYASCPRWDRLNEDIADHREALGVSLTLVADPFAEDPAQRAMAPWTVCKPFKTHFVVDLQGDWRSQLPRNPKRYAKKAFSRQNIFTAQHPAAHADVFWQHYHAMAGRLGAEGIQRMAPGVIARQLGMADTILFVAETGAGFTGALIVIDQDPVLHHHLTALTEQARDHFTSYGLIYASLEHAERLGRRYVTLGGGVGLADDDAGSLYRFKQRWANATRRSMFGGLVLDRPAYDGLAGRSARQGEAFFPAYRAPGARHAWRPGGAPAP